MIATQMIVHLLGLSKILNAQLLGYVNTQSAVKKKSVLRRRILGANIVASVVTVGAAGSLIEMNLLLYIQQTDVRTVLSRTFEIV